MNNKTQQEVKELKSKSSQFHDALFQDKIQKDTITNILSNTTNLDRQIIRTFYKKEYKVPIQDDINSKLSGSLKVLTLNMFDLPYEYDARELHRGLTSIVQENSTIIEILVTRPKSHLSLMREIYKKFYNKPIEQDINNLKSKDFSKFLLLLLDNERPKERTISTNDAYNISKEIIKNGIKSYSTDANLFQNLFLEKSRIDLILISRAFYELFKKNLYDSIKDETSGGNGQILGEILFSTITPSQYFAEKIKNAIKGLGTDEKTLNRVMVSRSEVDMDIIREYYFKDWKKTLKEDIKGDTSGHYGQILMNLSEK